MNVDWEAVLPSWATPELALEDWRVRIEQVAADESAHYAGLPFVTGLAVIGSVGRGTAWPLSDVDMLVVADEWHGQDPEDLIRAEDARRNEQLIARGIVNTVEACEWVLLTRDVVTAVKADEQAFLRMLAHPHWLGIVIKSEGARVVKDPDGWVGRFVDRCNRILVADGFARVWMERVAAFCGECLVNARRRLEAGDWAAASIQALRASYHQLASGFYAVWRRIPQSSAQSASRFLAAARATGDEEVARLYLTAARLEEPTVAQRISALPPEAKALHDVIRAVRRGAGEALNDLTAARDFLNLGVHCAIRQVPSGEWPEWVGAATDETAARSQAAAAQAMLERLKATAETLLP